jgi:hypothetical protein
VSQDGSPNCRTTSFADDMGSFIVRKFATIHASGIGFHSNRCDPCGDQCRNLDMDCGYGPCQETCFRDKCKILPLAMLTSMYRNVWMSCLKILTCSINSCLWSGISPNQWNETLINNSVTEDVWFRLGFQKCYTYQ